jgi:hypothetical protein
MIVLSTSLPPSVVGARWLVAGGRREAHQGYFVCAVTHCFGKFGELMAKPAEAAFRGIRFYFTVDVEGIGAMQGEMEHSMLEISLMAAGFD